MKKFLAVFVAMSALSGAFSVGAFATPAGVTVKSEVEELNSALQRVLLPLQNEQTKLSVTLQRAVLNEKRAVALEGKLSYSKDIGKSPEGEERKASLTAGISYDYPEKDGSVPTTKVDLAAQADLLKFISQEEFDTLDKVIGSQLERLTKEAKETYGDAAELKISSEAEKSDTENKEGHLTKLTVSLDAKFDVSKLTPELLKELPLVNGKAKIVVTPTEVTISLNFDGNTQYKGFDADSVGLKEWLTALLKQDQGKLKEIVEVLRLAEILIDGGKADVTYNVEFNQRLHDLFADRFGGDFGFALGFQIADDFIRCRLYVMNLHGALPQSDLHRADDFIAVEGLAAVSGFYHCHFTELDALKSCETLVALRTGAASADSGVILRGTRVLDLRFFTSTKRAAHI